MPVMTQYAAGTFCWPELMTTDVPAAKKFYSSLFRWVPNDSPMPDGGAYTMLELEGGSIGAMCPIQPEQTKAGVPPHWNAYVAVASADDAAKLAASLGGTVILPPFDVMDVGRMAVIQDPTGAVLSLWQAKAHAGAARVGEVGTLVWNELYTRNTEKAGTFYAGLFGWRLTAFPGPMEYTVFRLTGADQGVGGMMPMPAEMKDVPPHWLPYFRVDDVDATVAQARDLGGTICNPPMDIPTVGRIAMLADPQGAAFAILKVSEQM